MDEKTIEALASGEPDPHDVRRAGNSRLVYNKATRTIDTVRSGAIGGTRDIVSDLNEALGEIGFNAADARTYDYFQRARDEIERLRKLLGEVTDQWSSCEYERNPQDFEQFGECQLMQQARAAART